jgi:hypothetical protein
MPRNSMPCVSMVGNHVDSDAKNIERFRDGLHIDLYERLNLYEHNNYQDLVNKVIL